MPASWTYDATALSGTGTTAQLMQVRLLSGDTQQGDQQVFDQEVTFFLSQRPNVYAAAADVCRAIASKFARKVDTVQGELRTQYSTLTRNYQMRAVELDKLARTRGSGGLPYAGGISVADKSARVADGDRVAPQFNIGMEDNMLPVGPVGNETDAAPENDPGAF